MLRMPDVHEREEPCDVPFRGQIADRVEYFRPPRMEQAFDLGKTAFKIVIREGRVGTVVETFLGGEILRAGPEARASVFDRIDPHLAIGRAPLSEIAETRLSRL